MFFQWQWTGPQSTLKDCLLGKCEKMDRKNFSMLRRDVAKNSTSKSQDRIATWYLQLKGEDVNS